MRIRRPERDGIGPADLLRESAASITVRPLRSLLTAAGIAMGIATFVAVLGLTTSASARISDRFDVRRATRVEVIDAGLDEADRPFPADAGERLRRLPGVRAGGELWRVSPAAFVSVHPPVDELGPAVPTPVIAAGVDALDAIGPTFTGRLYDELLRSRHERVAVLGASIASRLGMDFPRQSTAFIGDVPFVVLGVIDNVDLEPELLLSVVVPDTTADVLWAGHTDEPRRVVVRTDPGAAQAVASQVALALRPHDPERLLVEAPPDPRTLRGQVESDVNALFVVLAAVSLVIGAIGIMNSTIVSVLERVPEIGVRRALGARRRDVALQFLAESAVLGSMGGVFGTASGLIAVVVITVTRGWTTVVEPLVVLGSPLLGIGVGLLAGAYPALKAAGIEPADAVRR